MKKMYWILITILLFGCTEEIDIPVTNNNSNIVVQGMIEKGEPAKILLTTNFTFNQQFSTQSILEQNVINDAEVIITNSDGLSEELSLVPELPNEIEEYFPALSGLNIYPSDTYVYNYSGDIIKGEEGESYLLEITRGDEYVWSITTIPTLIPIIEDDIQYIRRPTDEDDDDAGCYAYARIPIQDADTIGNCWQISSKRCWDKSYTSMAGGEEGLYNDEYINGWTTPIDIYPGIGFWESYDEEDDNNQDDPCFETVIDGCSGATDAFWSVGETFDLKFSTLDRASWDFWVSLLNNNPGNPFGSPSQAKSNINGGFGVFSGMSSQHLIELTIPEDLEIE